jgi:hypothetical protein
MVEDLFRHQMNLARFVSVDARGDETHAAPETWACRYQPSTKLLRTSSGSQSVSEAVLYVATEADHRDLIFPPGADSSDLTQSRRPIRVDRHFDPDSGAFSFSAIHI